MQKGTRGTRGETTQPPPGYEVIRTQGRHFPVCLHLDDPDHPGASAFQRPNGCIVSFAKRTSAILYLYQQHYQQPMDHTPALEREIYVDRSS